MHSSLTRRSALQRMAAGALAVPMAFRYCATAAPSETLRHASFGASGMAWADIQSLAASKHLKLVAVAEVDLNRVADVKNRFPDVKIYQDWRELLDKEKGLDSANISTPDHMHAAITMRAMQAGLHVYTQKPLTQTIYESRQLARVAKEKKLITQMGIQIHSHEVHRTVVATIQAGSIGKIKEVHSWSGKHWGDRNPRPTRKDALPAGFSWDGWLGVAQDRPFVAGYYHPGEWRKRLDFGTGTFGDMGCHILDPVFTSLELTAPTTVQSTGGGAGDYNWGLDSQVKFTFPGTKFTTSEVILHWYDGDRRPGAEVKKLLGKHGLSDQGSVYIGTEGVLFSPYIAWPILLPEDKFKDKPLTRMSGNDHYLQFVEACRGKDKPSAPFSYAGPMTEAVLLGTMSTRFPGEKLNWDAAQLTVSNNKKANALVRRTPRKGWEVEGL